MSNTSTQALEILKQEIKRDEEQEKEKERELSRIEEHIKEKKSELEKLEREAATLKSAIDQIKSKRESTVRDMETMQRELQTLLKK